MAITSGEAIQDPQSKKWGYVISHEDGSIISKSGYIFDSQKEAENELIKLLRGLGKYAQSLKS